MTAQIEIREADISKYEEIRRLESIQNTLVLGVVQDREEGSDEG